MKFSYFTGLAVLGLGACATPAPIMADNFAETRDTVSVLVMEPDVEVTFVTTSGPEYRADWTEAARANLMASLETQLEAGNETVLTFEADEGEAEAVRQLLLLNQAVTDAMMTHTVFVDPQTYAGPLPHKEPRELDYTLGESVAALTGEDAADYALFLTSRAYIESSGLFLTKMMIGVATGGNYVPPSANFRGTMVSLVDLDSGDVVWLGTTLQGDPREADEAANIMERVFKQSPLD